MNPVKPTKKNKKKHLSQDLICLTSSDCGKACWHSNKKKTHHLPHTKSCHTVRFQLYQTQIRLKHIQFDSNTVRLDQWFGDESCTTLIDMMQTGLKHLSNFQQLGNTSVTTQLKHMRKLLCVFILGTSDVICPMVIVLKGGAIYSPLSGSFFILFHFFNRQLYSFHFLHQSYKNSLVYWSLIIKKEQLGHIFVVKH